MDSSSSIMITSVPLFLSKLVHKGTFASCSPFKIAFETGATKASVTTTEDDDGYLKITSTPAGATIQIEGVNYRNVTPQSKISLNPGTYTVTLSLNGYNDISTPFTIKTGETTTVDVTLPKKATETPTQPTKSPFPIFGILAGLGAAAVLGLRRR